MSLLNPELIVSYLPVTVGIVTFMSVFIFLRKSRFSIALAITGLVTAATFFSYANYAGGNNTSATENWSRLILIAGIVQLVMNGSLVSILSGSDKNKNREALALIFLIPGLIFAFLIESGIAGKPFPAETGRLFLPLSFSIWLVAATGYTLFNARQFFFGNDPQLDRKGSLFVSLGLIGPILSAVLLMLNLIWKVSDIFPIASQLLGASGIFLLAYSIREKRDQFNPGKFWKHIIDHISEGVMIVDNDLQIRYVNQSFCKLTGYSRNELFGQDSVDRLVTGKYRHKLDRMAVMRRQGYNSKYEIPVISKNGEQKWLLVNGWPYYDDLGNVIGCIGIQTDITAIKLKENELRQTTERLNLAQAVAHTGSWELDFESGIGRWSDEACRIYGLSPDLKHEQTFDTWLSFIHPEDLDRVMKEVQTGREILGRSSFKHRIICTDGTIKFIHSVSMFEFDKNGQPKGLYGICHDLTEQYSNERALLESEFLNQTFINESKLAIYFANASTGEIRFANKAFHELAGYSESQVKDMKVSAFDGRQTLEINSNDPVRKRENTWLNTKGETIYVLESTFRRRLNGEDIVYVAALDITLRKKAEERLKAKNSELETFIYKASHDLRGPLASILGLAYLGMKDQDNAVSYIAKINETGLKLDGILLQLMEAMKFGRPCSQKEHFAPAQIIHEIVNHLELSEGYADVNITVDDSLPSTVISDRKAFETIIQNLVANAVKYRDHSKSQPSVSISLRAYNGKLMLLVRDNGIGMTHHVKDKAFEMYFRGEEFTKGSGLGLYLVGKAIDALNGTISVESIRGKGTTFKVELPVGFVNADNTDPLSRFQPEFQGKAA